MNGTLPSEWGKDHWSLLMYLALRAVDYQGKVNTAHLRTTTEYPTRLKEGAIGNHNDLDCIDDFERWGLLENKGTGLQPLVEFTDRGWDWVLDLMKHKAGGGGFHGFNPREREAGVTASS